MSEGTKKLPDWLIGCLHYALLGEIYSEIRAIAVSYTSSSLVLRYYLDREPTNFDYESIDIVAMNLDCALVTDENGKSIKKIDVECTSSKKPSNEIDPLNGFFYFRREHNM